MSGYQPGDVCIATVRGVKDMRVLRRIDHWVTGVRVGAEYVHLGCDVTDIRRLIVLDLDAVVLRNGNSDVVTDLRDPESMYAARYISNEIKAQTKPPRIPEPGQWGVVEASTPTVSRRRRFVRDDSLWRSTASGGGYDWDELAHPVLVREGVDS